MAQALSQDEINALLRSLTAGEIDYESPVANALDDIQQLDLTNQERIVRGRLPALELAHDRFARELRTILSKHLNRPCFVNMGGVELVKFGHFMKKLPLPSSMHIFRMPPLQGSAMMLIANPLVHTMVDVMMGGSGRIASRNEAREFTAIENRLIGKIVMLALGELKNSWEPVHNIDVVYVRSESNPLASAVAAASDLSAIISIEVELESTSSELTVCLPYPMIEPIKHKLSSGLQTESSGQTARERGKMAKHLKKTLVNVAVQLGKGQIKAKDVLELSVGDIIPLDTHADAPARVTVEGEAKFVGKIGSHRGQRAVTISRSLG